MLWSGKGKFSDYAMDFSPKQDNLMYAIISYGIKAAKEADFPDLAKKIEKENFIAEDIRNEMGYVYAEPVKQKNEYHIL